MGLPNILQLFSTLNKGWAMGIGKTFGHKLPLKRDISPQESISITANAIDISLGFSYVLVEDEIWVSTGIGVSFWNMSWKNVDSYITSELNKVLPTGFIGIGARPLPSLAPGILVSLGIIGTYLPLSYSLTSEIRP